MTGQGKCLLHVYIPLTHEIRWDMHFIKSPLCILSNHLGGYTKPVVTLQLSDPGMVSLAGLVPELTGPAVGNFACICLVQFIFLITPQTFSNILWTFYIPWLLYFFTVTQYVSMVSNWASVGPLTVQNKEVQFFCNFHLWRVCLFQPLRGGEGGNLTIQPGMSCFIAIVMSPILPQETKITWAIKAVIFTSGLCGSSRSLVELAS